MKRIAQCSDPNLGKIGEMIHQLRLHLKTAKCNAILTKHGKKENCIGEKTENLNH